MNLFKSDQTHKNRKGMGSSAVLRQQKPLSILLVANTAIYVQKDRILWYNKYKNVLNGKIWIIKEGYPASFGCNVGLESNPRKWRQKWAKKRQRWKWWQWWITSPSTSSCIATSSSSTNSKQLSRWVDTRNPNCQPYQHLQHS